MARCWRSQTSNPSSKTMPTNSFFVLMTPKSRCSRRLIEAFTFASTAAGARGTSTIRSGGLTSHTAATSVAFAAKRLRATVEGGTPAGGQRRELRAADAEPAERVPDALDARLELRLHDVGRAGLPQTLDVLGARRSRDDVEPRVHAARMPRRELGRARVRHHDREERGLCEARMFEHSGIRGVPVDHALPGLPQVADDRGVVLDDDVREPAAVEHGRELAADRTETADDDVTAQPGAGGVGIERLDERFPQPRDPPERGERRA